MKIKNVLILGSGGLRIGQAGEFDYSGSQAIKALKEEGIRTILINPNIATVQTDKDMADRVYLQPLSVLVVKQIIEKEKPDAILLSVGGQTALNLGLELEELGVLEKHGVKPLGTPLRSIRITEDRDLFKQALAEIKVKTAKSFCVTTIQDAVEAGRKIGYPLMMRAGFSLGGLGSGQIHDEAALLIKAKEAFHHAQQLLIEENLFGWKEIEYEVVRDLADNVITVCNMENFDPMGIHTGESIVVAPSQTLTNAEYHMLREVAIKCARKMEVVGECNIQYALFPHTGEYRVIEMNARLSRSSALASKATGYPLAFVSTKLTLGKRLDEIQNNVTKKTTAFFEPALDYIVVKIPRWDIQKLKSAERQIGTEMKSVGEVMAIGRSFAEALQKAVRMLNIGPLGLGDYPYAIVQPMLEIKKATDRRLFALYRYFLDGGTVEEAAKASQIDQWFLDRLSQMASIEKKIDETPLDQPFLHHLKKFGFADGYIAKLKGVKETQVRTKRISLGILPVIKQIDTLAGEFDAETNYLYLTYHGDRHDLKPSRKRPIIILGSGPYCIGSSVEFDWCQVTAAKRLRQKRQTTVIINCNPETVSTDYDESDRLYFEELTLERVKDITDFENPQGVIVSFGGQAANNLAYPLSKSGISILGTSAKNIDRAENRQIFSSMLASLGIDQPAWVEVASSDSAKNFAKKIGYPLLVRPSYVLSGSAMKVIFSDLELGHYLKEAAIVSRAHPVVLSKFIVGGKELEIDGVAKDGELIIEAVSEHIENAGIHSGDATIVLPPQRLYMETIRRTKRITKAIVEELAITGPFNIQFIAIDNAIKVIECNVRASRSFPFVSKVTNHNFIEIAIDAMIGKRKPEHYETLELDYVGVKSPQFSYSRLKGANPVAHVEMASTGEVACIGDYLHEAFFMSWLATGQKIDGKRILLSIGGDKKVKLFDAIYKLNEQGWEIFATENTHDYLFCNGVASKFIYKASDEADPNIVDLILEKQVDIIINIPRALNSTGQQTDGYKIRRLAIDHNIPLITNLHVAQLFLECLTSLSIASIPIRSWQEYMNDYIEK